MYEHEVFIIRDYVEIGAGPYTIEWREFDDRFPYETWPHMSQEGMRLNPDDDTEIFFELTGTWLIQTQVAIWVEYTQETAHSHWDITFSHGGFWRRQRSLGGRTNSYTNNMVAQVSHVRQVSPASIDAPFRVSVRADTYDNGLIGPFTAVFEENWTYTHIKFTRVSPDYVDEEQPRPSE